MLEKIRYVNHINEEIVFGSGGIFADASDIRDYEWSITKKNEMISSLSRKITKFKLPVTIVCNTEAEGIAARNRLFEVVEKDVIAGQYGRLIVGGYYCKCYVTKSQKKDYLYTGRHIKLTLTLTTDLPFWTRESSISFSNVPTGSSPGVENALDFPFDYSFDYFSGKENTQLNNPDFTSTNFRLIIYGACVNPSITIGGHVYAVNCEIASGEYLTIDSREKKIYLTSIDGTQTNKFNNRNKASYIFEKIPPGVSTVAWDGSHAFDVVLLEERSEPKWT